MSNEHVEVLRNLSEVCRAAIKAGDWKVDGACDPDAVLRRADSAIASLSAPQPPAEAQPVDGLRMVKLSDAWDYAHGALSWNELDARAIRRPAEAQGGRERVCDCGANPENRYPHHDDCAVNTAPPSAPVGVEVWLRPVVTQGEYVAKWGFCNPDDPGATPFYSNALAQQPAAKTIVIADCPHCGYTELSEGQRAKLAAELVGQQPAAVAPVGVEAMLSVAKKAWHEHQTACRFTTVSGSLKKVCEALAQQPAAVDGALRVVGRVVRHLSPEHPEGKSVIWNDMPAPGATLYVRAAQQEGA